MGGQGSVDRKNWKALIKSARPLRNPACWTSRTLMLSWMELSGGFLELGGSRGLGTGKIKNLALNRLGLWVIKCVSNMCVFAHPPWD